MNDAIWDRLQIAATRDEASIRRAYAVQLKRIDPEAEPARFIALRHAFEQARAFARAWPDDDEAAPFDAVDTDAEIAPDGPAIATEVPDRIPEPARAPAPLVAAAPTWMADVDAIERLIWSDTPAADIRDELIARTTQILHDPAMLSIAHAAEIERWAIDIAIDGMPRSDALLILAADHFDWVATAERWDCPPRIREVMKRYWDIGWVQSLERDGRADERFDEVYALALLRDPSLPPRGGPAAMVAALLGVIRRHHPTALHDVSPAAVTAWDAYLTRRDARWYRRAGRWLLSLSPAAWYDRRQPGTQAILARIWQYLVWTIGGAAFLFLCLVLIAIGPIGWVAAYNMMSHRSGYRS